MSSIPGRLEPQASSPRSLSQWAREHQLVTFFILAYAFSWLVWLPLVLGQDGLGLLPFSVPAPTVLIILGQFAGPTLVAFLMTRVVDGRAGMRELLRRYVQWRVGLRWYLVALIAPPIALLLGVSVFRAGELARSLADGGLMLVPLYLLTLAVLLFFGGPLAENPGWRGFALPRLQAQYGALGGSLVLGVLWFLWHGPLFLIASANTWEGSLLVYLLGILGMTIVFTWVYNQTRGSLLLVILLHAAVDTSTRLFLPNIEGLTRAEGNAAILIAFGVWGLLLVAATRGRLGYERGAIETGEQ